MIHFSVYREDGSEVVKGDTIQDFRGETWQFESCTHPRKIWTNRKEDHNGPNSWPNRQLGEYYPSVFNLRIDAYE